MCRIAGIIGNKNVKPENIVKALLSMESGGKDATGMAWFDGEQVWTMKSPMMASDFVENQDVRRELPRAAKAKWILLHTRQATHGGPENNLNNHPIVSQKGLIIHNGVVSPSMNLSGARGQTDTEQIMLHIQKYGFKGLENMNGWLAIAYVNFKRPDRVYLYRDGVPIVYSSNGFFAFASTQAILKDGFDIESTKTLPIGKVFKVILGNPVLEKVMKVRPHDRIITVGRNPAFLPWFLRDGSQNQNHESSKKGQFLGYKYQTVPYQRSFIP